MIRGWTVVATVDFPKGFVICDYGGVAMSRAEWEQKHDRLQLAAEQGGGATIAAVERFKNFTRYRFPSDMTKEKL